MVQDSRQQPTNVGLFSVTANGDVVAISAAAHALVVGRSGPDVSGSPQRKL
jgi:hypothetical protein